MCRSPVEDINLITFILSLFARQINTLNKFQNYFKNNAFSSCTPYSIAVLYNQESEIDPERDRKQRPNLMETPKEWINIRSVIL